MPNVVECRVASLKIEYLELVAEPVTRLFKPYFTVQMEEGVYFGSEDFMLMLNHSRNRLGLRSNVEGRGGGRWLMADD